MVKEQVSEAAMIAGASKATYSGVGAGFLGWVFSSEFAMLVGLIVALSGFFVNWYYSHRRHQREEREHRARMCEHTPKCRGDKDA